MNVRNKLECLSLPSFSILVSILPIFYEQLFAFFHMKVFCAAYMCLQFGFVIFWQKDFGAKAAHKMLVKLTPGLMFVDKRVT
jgi:hypothetical protein